MSAGVVHNAEGRQFEVRDGDSIARLAYRMKDGVIDLVHTEVPKEMAGRGVAGDLAQAALEFAAANDLTVRPSCSFVRSYLERHRTSAKIDESRM